MVSHSIQHMADINELKGRIKSLMIENLMLQTPADEIGDDTLLFSPEGLALDSVDALQLVVVLDKNFGLKIQDTEIARQVLASVNSMAEAVAKNQQTAG